MSKWPLVSGCVAIAAVAGLAIAFLIRRQEVKHSNRVALEAGVVCMVAAEYYRRARRLPTDYSEIRDQALAVDSDMRPADGSRFTWRARKDEGDPHLFADDILILTVSGVDSTGSIGSETCEIKTADPKNVWDVQWGSPTYGYSGNLADVDHLMADALAQMVFDKNLSLGFPKNYQDHWLFKEFKRLNGVANYQIRITSKNGKPSIGVLSKRSRLIYRYSYLGPDVSDRVEISPSG